jgi:DNA-directed RNA polymerase specialized sigma24 family protein
MMQMTDLELVDRAAAGDEDAFVDLVERYKAIVRSQIRRFGIHPNDVDDVYNEFVCKLWRELRSLSRYLRADERDGLAGLFAMKAWRACCNYIEKRGNVQPWCAATKKHAPNGGGRQRLPESAVAWSVQDYDAAESCDHVADVDNRDEAQFFMSAIDARRQSLVADRLDGHEYPEIAEAHGLYNCATARMSYLRAIERMRRRIRPDTAYAEQAPQFRRVIHGISYFGLILREIPKNSYGTKRGEREHANAATGE